MLDHHLDYHFANFCENCQNRKTIAFGEILRKYCFYFRFYRNTLIRLLLHAEFIFAVKTEQNPMVFEKN